MLASYSVDNFLNIGGYRGAPYCSVVTGTKRRQRGLAPFEQEN